MSSSQAAVEVQPHHSSPEKPAKIKINRIEYDGRASAIFGIWALNFFMKIITIGIYSFWGKTRIRKYVTSCFSLGGDRFEYTGTGGELFKGFLKALPIILIMYGPFFVGTIIGGEEALWPILFLIPMVYFVPMA